MNFMSQKQMSTLDLGSLASHANHEINLAEQVAETALEHMRAAGLYLIAAKEKVGKAEGYGHWGKWVRANIDGKDKRTAERYMQIARDWRQVSDAESGNEALRRLSQSPEEEDEEPEEDDHLGQINADLTCDMRVASEGVAKAAQGGMAKAPGKPVMASGGMETLAAEIRAEEAEVKVREAGGKAREKARKEAKALLRADEHFRRGIVRCRAVGLDWDAVTARFAEWVERVRAVEAEKEEAAETVEV